MNMENEQRCTPPESRTCGAKTSGERSAELQSWIDNVIVPILVQEILKTRRTVGEDLGVAPTKGEKSGADPDADRGI
jgi:hypothetical protein